MDVRKAAVFVVFLVTSTRAADETSEFGTILESIENPIRGAANIFGRRGHRETGKTRVLIDWEGDGVRNLLPNQVKEILGLRYLAGIAPGMRDRMQQKYQQPTWPADDYQFLGYTNIEHPKVDFEEPPFGNTDKFTSEITEAIKKNIMGKKIHYKPGLPGEYAPDANVVAIQTPSDSIAGNDLMKYFAKMSDLLTGNFEITSFTGDGDPSSYASQNRVQESIGNDGGGDDNDDDDDNRWSDRSLNGNRIVTSVMNLLGRLLRKVGISIASGSKTDGDREGATVGSIAGLIKEGGKNFLNNIWNNFIPTSSKIPTASSATRKLKQLLKLDNGDTQSTGGNAGPISSTGLSPASNYDPANLGTALLSAQKGLGQPFKLASGGSQPGLENVGVAAPAQLGTAFGSAQKGLGQLFKMASGGSQSGLENIGVAAPAQMGTALGSAQKGLGQLFKLPSGGSQSGLENVGVAAYGPSSTSNYGSAQLGTPPGLKTFLKAQESAQGLQQTATDSELENIQELKANKDNELTRRLMNLVPGFQSPPLNGPGTPDALTNLPRLQMTFRFPNTKADIKKFRRYWFPDGIIPESFENSLMKSDLPVMVSDVGNQVLFK